jgi:hypothetical protein
VQTLVGGPWPSQVAITRLSAEGRILGKQGSEPASSIGSNPWRTATTMANPAWVACLDC